MHAAGQRPLLFLDVDRPLLPFGAAPGQDRRRPAHTASTGYGSNPLLARLDPQHGSRLAALPCDLVWATSWMSDANESIAPRLGLPSLAVVQWPECSDVSAQDEWDGLHWKTRTLVDWAAGRPFAWADDEITESDRAWVSAHHPGRALLRRVSAAHGLTDADYSAIRDWLRRSGAVPCTKRIP